MSATEKPTLSEKMTLCTDKRKQAEFFCHVRNNILESGLSIEVLDTIADLPIHGLSLRRVIEMNISEGVLRIENGNIISNHQNNENEN